MAKVSDTDSLKTTFKHLAIDILHLPSITHPETVLTQEDLAAEAKCGRKPGLASSSTSEPIAIETTYIFGEVIIIIFLWWTSIPTCALGMLHT